MDTRVNFCMPGGKFLYFPICMKLGTKQCTKKNRHPGQKQSRETHMSWFNPSWHLGTGQPLAHSPAGGMGRDLEG